ncbi:MAG: hypothetical protein ACOZCL_10620 [Bacillota bacterium]
MDRNNKMNNSKSKNVDFTPLTSIALRRVRFVTNIIDRNKLFDNNKK